jgi:hypothetical protein
MSNFAVQFSNEVKQDYNCIWNKKASFTMRFKTIEAALKAAEIYTRNQPEKPYCKEATVHKGSLIVTPVHTAFIAYKYAYLNPYINYVIVN